MRRPKFTTLFLVLLAGLLVLSSMALAQTQQIPRGGGESTGGASAAPPPSSGTVSARDNSSSVGMPSFSNTPSDRTYIPNGSSNYGGSTGGGGGTYTGPSYNQFINERTSFYSYDSYIRSNMLFDLLRLYYGSSFNRQYFSRYYLNSEPILNRKTLYYSLQNSYSRTGQLAQAVMELNQLVQGYQQRGGSQAAAVRDPRWSLLASRIRTLAKQIKEDEFLPYVDVRRNSDDPSIKTANVEKLSYIEQSSRLTELVTRLNSQLSGMMSDSTPAVVSVDSLTQPTIESLAKEIERLAKNLAKANPRS